MPWDQRTGLLDEDLAAHAGLEVPGLQASEVDGPGPGELPDELAGPARFQAHLVRIFVFHLGKSLHELGVLAQLLCRSEHHPCLS